MKVPKPSILFLTTSANWPLTDGKRQRTWFLLKALSVKYTVDVLLIGYQDDKNQFNITTSSTNKLYFFDVNILGNTKMYIPNFLLSNKQKFQKIFFLKELNDFFTDLYRENKYNYVFSRYLQSLLYLNIPKEIKVICDLDDIYFELQKTRAKYEQNFIKKLKLQVLYYLGLKSIKSAIDLITIPIIVKESDRCFYGMRNALCLPNLPFGVFIDRENNILLKTNTESVTRELIFGFIGKLSYRANYNGLLYFINNVWNSYIKNNSQAKLVIAGSGEIPEKLRSAIESSKNIVLLGFVESAELFWNQISVLVVPIAEGGGSNIKVAEAFIHGKKVIAHPFASRGYNDFIDSGYLILPKDTDSWIMALDSLKSPKPNEINSLIQKATSYFDLNKWNQIIYNAIK